MVQEIDGQREFWSEVTYQPDVDRGAITGENWMNDNSWYKTALQLPKPSLVVNWNGLKVEDGVLAYTIFLAFK